MKELIPIDTEYKGYYFRSRLEARWAVFFEKMGWEWKYEHEGFKLPSGNYLPDFYFPSLNLYAEVKPQQLNQREFKLCCELSDIVSKEMGDISVLLLEGDVSLKSYRCLSHGAFFNDVVPMPNYHKFYPFFYSSSFDRKYFTETTEFLLYAKKARFEFEWKEM